MRRLVQNTWAVYRPKGVSRMSTDIPGRGTPPLKVLAWLATLISVILLIMLRILYGRYVRHDAEGDFELWVKIIEAAVGSLATLSMALVIIVRGFAWSSFMATLSFLLWLAGLVMGLTQWTEAKIADATVVGASIPIVLVHLTHSGNALSRRWSRLLNHDRAMDLLIVLVAALIGVSIIIATVKPAAFPIPTVSHTVSG